MTQTEGSERTVGKPLASAMAEAGQTERGALTHSTCVYSGSVFATRTHVSSHNPPKLDLDGGKESSMPVFKKQHCRSDTRFDEIDTLDHIHELGQVPGVVVYAYATRTPSTVV